MTVQNKLPPEFERIAELAEPQPPEIQEVFHFLLAVALEESGKATLINTAHVDGRVYYSYDTAAGDVFSVVRPDIDAEMEKALREELVGILEEESGERGINLWTTSRPSLLLLSRRRTWMGISRAWMSCC